MGLERLEGRDWDSGWEEKGQKVRTLAEQKREVNPTCGSPTSVHTVGTVTCQPPWFGYKRCRACDSVRGAGKRANALTTCGVSKDCVLGLLPYRPTDFPSSPVRDECMISIRAPEPRLRVWETGLPFCLLCPPFRNTSVLLHSKHHLLIV